MDPKLYKAARAGDVEFLMGNASDDVRESLLLLSPLKNNALHIAAKLGHKLFCQKVLELGPQTLLSQKNATGDTPLHLAAGAGHLELVRFFVESYQHPTDRDSLQWTAQASGDNRNSIVRNLETMGDLEGGEVFEHPLKIKNTENNTTLHLALKNRHEQVALYLLEVEQDLACFANSDGESPLFLAVAGCCSLVLNKILERGELVSLEGPNGQSPLHNAVVVKNTKSINFLQRSVPELIKQSDSDGRTALHYAVVARSLRMVRLLLKWDASVAYIVDKDGASPLHLAARSGTSATCRAILNFCPDCIELLDMYGRNALHLAVKHNSIIAVRRLLRIPSIRELINERDGEGNTALHLATKNNHYLMVRRLIRTKGIQVTAKNKDGLTPLDICESDMEISFRQRTVRSLLLRLKAPRGKEGANRDNIRFKSTMLTHPKADLKQMGNTLVVIATLLAAVTFTAAFTMPGGYSSNGPNIGVPVFVHKAAFKAFIFADAVAICCSMVVVFNLIWAVLGDPAYLILALGNSIVYLQWAFLATIVAYITGIYVVVSSHSLWLAIVVCIMGSIVPFEVSRLRGISRQATPAIVRAELNKTKRFLGRTFTSRA